MGYPETIGHPGGDQAVALPNQRAAARESAPRSGSRPSAQATTSGRTTRAPHPSRDYGSPTVGTKATAKRIYDYDYTDGT